MCYLVLFGNIFRVKLWCMKMRFVRGRQKSKPDLIEVYVYLGNHNGKIQRTWKATSVRVKESEWNGEGVIRHPFKDKLNKQLQGRWGEVSDAANGCKTIVELNRKLNPKTNGELLLADLVRNHTDEQNPSDLTMRGHATVANHISIWRSALLAKDLTMDDLNNFADYLLKSTSVGSSSTALQYIQTISGALNWAVRNKKIAANVYNNSELNFKVVRKKHIGLTKIERDAILALDPLAIGGRTDSNATRVLAHKAFCWSCLTGMRSEDIRNLKRGNLIKTNEGYQLKFHPLKKNKEKDLEVIQDLWLSFNGLPNKFITEHLETVSGEFVFPLSQYQIGAYVSSFCKAIGAGHKRLHDARHTAGSLWIEDGLHLEEVQYLMGHRDVESTKIYAKTGENRARLGLKRVFEMQTS